MVDKDQSVVTQPVEIGAQDENNPAAEKVFTSDTSEVMRLSWNIDKLILMKENGQIDFDSPVQRGYVWNLKKKSFLIRSTLKGIPTASLYFNRRKADGVYECLEGKQRADAWYGFKTGLYSLHASTPPIKVRGKEIILARKSYKDLSKELQVLIDSYNLEAHSFEDMSLDEKVEFFVLINSGKPVSATEISRIRVKSRNVFLKMTEHTAVKTIVRPSVIRSGADEDIIENIWILCNTETPSLLNKSRSPILATAIVTKDQEKEMTKALDYIVELCKVAKKMDKKVFSRMQHKTHIESIGYAAIMAIRNSISQDDFVEKTCAFFNVEGRASTVSERYNAAARAETAKPHVIAIRLEELNLMLGI